MRIGELSERTGVPAHRLRYYEDRALLVPRRTGNGYREFDEAAVGEVTRIRALLEAGLSTEDIAAVLPCARGEEPAIEPCPDLLATLRARRDDLDRRIDALTRSRTALDRYVGTAEGR